MRVRASSLSTFEPHGRYNNTYFCITRADVFLRAFAELQKGTIRVVASVRLTFHMEHLRSHRMDYHEILHFVVFRESVLKI